MKKKKILFDPADLTKVVKKIKVKGEKKFYSCPAIEFKVINKVGAGDAMFALASVCDSMNFEPEITLLIGSIASYYNLGVLGNESNIDVNYLKKIIYQLLQ